MVWHTLVKEAPLWLFERNLSKSLDRGRVDLIYAAAPRAFESFSQIAIIVKIVKVNEETFNHILYFSQRGGCLGGGVEVWPDL